MLDVLTTFPTVLFTIVLGVASIYWLFVVLGALDLNILGGAEDGIDGAIGAAKGASEGALDGMAGAAKGASEGAFDGMAGAAKGASEGALDGHGFHGADGGHGVDGHGLDGADADGLHGGHAGEAFSLIGALRLRRAPITVVITFFSLFGWITSIFLTTTVAPLVSMPVWLSGALMLLLATTAALLCTSVAIRPLERFFAVHTAKSAKDFVGQVGVVSTGYVDTTFGQATLEDGGAGLILQVRCDDTTLKRGDRVLLVGFDKETGCYDVEPFEPLVAAPPHKAPLAEEEAEDSDVRAQKRA